MELAENRPPPRESLVYRALGARDLDAVAAAKQLPDELLRSMKIVAEVFPFRVNGYVVDELIDWNRVPDDPMFQLTFPQRDMLEDDHYRMLQNAIDGGLPRDAIERIVRRIRLELNPHPARQILGNIPVRDHHRVPGVQRKYRETALVFPSQGQTCHAYCTYCFRWPQFVMRDLKFATDQARQFADFLREEKDLTDVLITGGDPMVMKSSLLRRYLEPLLGPGFDHIQNIRVGTKAVAYWPHRFVTDPDADDVLRLFERVVDSGKHLALMAHYSHPHELATDIAEEAVGRIRTTGAVIRTQSPVIRHVNDDADAWAQLWRRQVRLGMVPYYMFVERDTGPRRYFELPLVRTWRIFRTAYQRISGLGRTVRGPSMSADPGKVLVEGVCDIAGEDAFVLRFLQARNPEWVGRPFLARFDPDATWLDQLVPFRGDEFFFEAKRSVTEVGDPGHGATLS